MTSTIERNAEMLDEFDKDTSEHITIDGHSDSNSVQAEQTKLDAVRRVSTGMYLTASEALGYGMDSVKRAATGLGAGITRAGQNVADKMQKSPKIPKSMRRRAEVDELSVNIISDESDYDDDDDVKMVMPRKSSKEALARKKRQESKKKENKLTW